MQCCFVLLYSPYHRPYSRHTEVRLRNQRPKFNQHELYIYTSSPYLPKYARRNAIQCSIYLRIIANYSEKCSILKLWLSRNYRNWSICILTNWNWGNEGKIQTGMKFHTESSHLLASGAPTVHRSPQVLSPQASRSIDAYRDKIIFVNLLDLIWLNQEAKMRTEKASDRTLITDFVIDRIAANRLIRDAAKTELWPKIKTKS